MKISVYLFTFIIFTHSCEKNPVTPKGEPPYNNVLFLGDENKGHVYVVDTDRNVVVDTIGFDKYIWEFAVTHSGAKLYVCTRESSVNRPGKIYSLDLRTREKSIIWAGLASDVFAAPDGEVFIFSYEPRWDKATEGTTYVGIIDTLSDAITFIDTLDIRDIGHNYQSVAFDGNRPLLYAVREDDRLFAYNYETRQVERIYENISGPLKHMITSPDGKTLYVAGGPVFDLEQDSVIAWVGGNYLGSLALSPDGERLYITDPGGYLRLEPVPTGKIKIFETSSNSYTGYIDVRQAVVPPDHLSVATDRIVLMPDGKTAYVSNWIQLVFVVDLQLKAVKKTLVFGPIETQIVQMALNIKITN